MNYKLFVLSIPFLSTISFADQHLNAFSFKNSGMTMDYYPSTVSTAGNLNEIARFMADQLAQNRDSMNISQNPIAVTSIVNLQNFKKTNKVGLWLTENLMHELHTRGFKTIDFKTMPAIQVTPSGDFVLSREVEELRGKYNINQVLTGTFAEHENGVVINARLIDMETSVVVSSAQANISAAHYLRMMKNVADGVPKIVVEKKVIPAVKQHQVELRGEAFCKPSEPCFYK